VQLLPEIAAEMGFGELLQQDRYTVYRPVATEENPSGYFGRTTILELLQMSDPIRRLIMQQATSGDIHNLAVNEGMRTMYQDGLLKCLQGVTTIEEILRVTQEA
jgi:general secretion pathway protein E